MTADARPMTAPRHIPIRRRIYGFGSLFGKTLRDSRRAILIVAGFLALMIVVSGAFVSSQWGTPDLRAEGVALTTALPPIFTGLYGGAAVSPETLGGFTNWRYGIMFFLLPGIWSLLALSGTLISEVRRGSMDFVAASPITRARIAIEKVGAHVAAMAIAMLIVGLTLWGVGLGFATLPGDEIPLTDALSYALLMGLAGLAAGAVAFGLAPFVGRGAAAGFAALFLVGSWLINGYADSVPVFEMLAPISFFSWTADHRPIAGIHDPVSMLWPALIAVGGLALGTLTFVRRDLGELGALRLASLPTWMLGITGPLRRTLGERFGAITAWGLGIGVYALIIATSSTDLQRVIEETPSLSQIMQAAFPNVDLADPGFGLQLLFVQFGTLAIGFAAAALVGGWSSDESEGRLEMLLTTPVPRMRWALLTGLGTYAAILAVAVVVAIVAAVGVAVAGQDPVTPLFGTFVLALQGWAAAGVGLAVGGLVRPSLAAPAVIVIVVGWLLIEILAPLLELPEWIGNLVLARHYGEPMIGNWDPVGIFAALAIAAVGLVIGAWGFTRRDLRG
jgi:ABC-2 type transport system permease protein